MTVFLHTATNSFADVLMIALQSFRESYSGLLSSTLILVKSVQPKKAPVPIDVTLLGMLTEDRLLHRPNAELPIDVTLLGMVTKDRLLQ